MSGGADSTALALLAADWARARGGAVLALVVDHGLRDGSAGEAQRACRRMDEHGVANRLLTLGRPLAPGAALAVRARQARFDVLTDAARAAGSVHLLLGHHAGDQAETLLMRRRAGSGAAGNAGIAALREVADLRILRPLLDVPAAALRRLLQDRGVDWTEDPSNHDLHSERARLRLALADPNSDTGELLAASRDAAALRTRRSVETAAVLARRATISPLGYAVLSPGPIAPEPLAALWQAIAGAGYPPPAAAIARLAAAPGPATLGGLRLLPAGRCGPGWLLVRERAAPAAVARDGAVWDRFVLTAADLPPGLAIGAVGDAAATLRRASDLPACILRTLPALFDGASLVSVPHLDAGPDGPRFAFRAPVVAAGAPWCGVC